MEVVRQANVASLSFFCAGFAFSLPQQLKGKQVLNSPNPKRSTSGVPALHDPDPIVLTTKCYASIAKTATENLMKFLSKIQPPQAVSVMYFDEAHQLGFQFWILL